MMRILHLDTGKTERGGQIFLKHLHHALLQQGVSSFLLVHARNPLWDEDNPFFWAPRNEGDILAMFSLLKTIKKIRPHILHAHDSRSLGLLYWTRPIHRLPVLMTRGLSRPIKAWGKYRSTHMVAISSFVRERLMASGISPSRLHLIPVGIPDKPLPDRPFPYELKSREGAFRILFVGALEPWKDPMVLLRAADLLRDHPFHFVFIGDGPLKASMVKWIRDKNLQDVVQLIGPLPKAQQYMGHFDCLVLPSREEAFGLVILEALQKGLPVVVSHCPSFQEILRPLQKTYSFPQKNAQALAEVLLNLLRDPEGARQWVYQAQEKVLPQYTLSTIAQRYMALYQNLLSSPA